MHIQRLQEKEGALESVCKEMEGEKSHYERRIGELSGSHSDANSKIKLLEVGSHACTRMCCIVHVHEI